MARSSSMMEWFLDDFYPRHGKSMWVVLAIIAIAYAGYSFWSSNHEKTQIADNKKLGVAYVLLGEGRTQEAERSLNELINGGISGLARDKANLYLGKIHYDAQEYDQALEIYSKVKKDKSTVLVYSGALHGQAACYMQKKDYTTAIAKLDEFLALCMRRTGNPKEDLAGEEVVDLNPTVPNALWKEALCYRELQQPDKVKVAVEKLQKAYPASPEAQDGAKLLATLK